MTTDTLPELLLPLPEPKGVIVVGTQALRGFTADQMHAYALQVRAHATQAEVTDEQILSLDCVSIDSDEHGTSFWVDRSTVIKFARAILALRPAAVPMTREQAMAIVQSNPDTMTAIRMTEAHHCITAQAKKDGA